MGKRSPVGGGQLGAIRHRPLELVTDDHGSVTVGWVDVGVFYARFIGVLSIELSRQHTARLETALERRPSLHYFADCRALESYDLAARTDFMRVLGANRSQFKSIVLLTWPLGITPTARAHWSAIGEPVEILADERAFEAQLLETAPLARGKLDPNGWVLPPASTRAHSR
jgi:hypothetical protein